MKLSNGQKKGRIDILHLALHFIVPALITLVIFRKHWKMAYLVMISTMLVDLDHLFAEPIYYAGRCSIGFHPLHEFGPITIYTLLCFFPKTRYLGIGLIIHMILDSIDCQITGGVWFVQKRYRIPKAPSTLKPLLLLIIVRWYSLDIGFNISL